MITRNCTNHFILHYYKIFSGSLLTVLQAPLLQSKLEKFLYYKTIELGHLWRREYDFFSDSDLSSRYINVSILSVSEDETSNFLHLLHLISRVVW